MKDAWRVYVVECSDGSYYCGVTNNIERRMKSHNSGIGAKYTRGRRPVMLRGLSPEMTRSAALKFEAAIKKQSHDDKLGMLLKGRKSDG